MNYYIADMHLGHENIIAFDNRPFRSVNEMNRVLMDNWNRKVGQDDDVYILGDFSYCSETDPVWYLEQLKGTKHLIQGNHDGHLLRSGNAGKYLASVDKMLHITDGGEHIVLCHFPIAEWNGFSHGSWHIYGHIHGNVSKTSKFMKGRKKALNAGCMLNGYEPVTFAELVENNK
ncbi:MAG: hydrolase [Dorea sp.]|nr:hydrolase [Dorea sp.]